MGGQLPQTCFSVPERNVRPAPEESFSETARGPGAGAQVLDASVDFSNHFAAWNHLRGTEAGPQAMLTAGTTPGEAGDSRCGGCVSLRAARGSSYGRTKAGCENAAWKTLTSQACSPITELGACPNEPSDSGEMGVKIPTKSD